MITKGAGHRLNYARRTVAFPSARTAFGAILKALEIGNGKVLLPAYIGWSAREGSGVFDPIAALGLQHAFYALDGRLRIDLDSLRRALEGGGIRVVVLIHYFGYVDPAYEEAVRLAREFGAFVLEDEAHAMLTDLVGGVSGQLGDACIYSLHKMLPLEGGGAAVINDPESPLAQALEAGARFSFAGDQYDLLGIAGKRRSNALLVDRLLRDLAPEVEPLFGAPRSGECPQTYPVLIRSASRDNLYHEMNAAGFGVVSLYHTLIPQISVDDFAAAAGVSRRILNLPVHQDVAEEDIRSMMGKLTEWVRKQ